MAGVKEAVAAYVRDYHARMGKVPSVLNIIENAPTGGVKLSRSSLYELFPGGLSEICSAAGVQLPADRKGATKAALDARRRKAQDEEGRPEFTITLTPEQSKRLLGAAQLEGSGDPLAVVDGMLDLDTERRKSGLTLTQEIFIVQFLREAGKRGWNSQMLTDILTKIWNAGFMNLSDDLLRDLGWLLSNFDMSYWGGLQKFVEYVKQHNSTLPKFKAYTEGKISLDDFLHSVSMN